MFSTTNGLYERARKRFKVQDGIKLFTYSFYRQRRQEVQVRRADFFALRGPYDFRTPAPLCNTWPSESEAEDPLTKPPPSSPLVHSCLRPLPPLLPAVLLRADLQ